MSGLNPFMILLLLRVLFRVGKRTYRFRISIFEFVSDFEFRISDFVLTVGLTE
jgi:hypothetical protein